MAAITTDAVIVGSGRSAYLRRPPATATTGALLADAGVAALEAAGLGLHDVDGLAVGSFTLAPDHAIDLAWKLGLRVGWLMDDHTGGAGALNMLAHAATAVAAGEARCILILAGDVMRDADFARLTAEYNAVTRDHLAPIGYGGPNGLFALLSQRHRRREGLDSETYGHVAVAQRAWAATNPEAVYRSPLTMGEYLAAPLVADPLVRFDCVPVVSGADAVVVTAPDLPVRRPNVRITALAASHNRDDQEGDGLTTGLADLAADLWSTAAVRPTDVDVVSVYDDYTTMVLVQLADLGFIADGDVAAFAAREVGERRRPINTSGGQLSAGQAGAGGSLHGLVEVVRQLQSREGERQIAGARVGLVSGYGMALYRYCACANAVLLEGAA
jgi:acetyl-CoA acetyltransferase